MKVSKRAPVNRTTVPFNFRVKPELRGQIEELAAKHFLGVGAMASVLIRYALEVAEVKGFDVVAEGVRAREARRMRELKEFIAADKAKSGRAR